MDTPDGIIFGADEARRMAERLRGWHLTHRDGLPLIPRPPLHSLFPCEDTILRYAMQQGEYEEAIQHLVGLPPIVFKASDATITINFPTTMPTPTAFSMTFETPEEPEYGPSPLAKIWPHIRFLLWQEEHWRRWFA